MRLIPITIAEAEKFLATHKRHYVNPGTDKIGAIGIGDSELHGAAVLARLPSNDGWVGCIAHIYVDGSFGGYTTLYGACWRALHAMGYEYVKL